MKKYALIKGTNNSIEVICFYSKTLALLEYKMSWVDYYLILFVVEDVKVLDNYEYNPEVKHVTITIEGKIDDEYVVVDFHIQLFNGKYLPQMGCLIYTGASISKGISYKEFILYKALGLPISNLAEEAYQDYLNNMVNH
jgi:hypothetical protein